MSQALHILANNVPGYGLSGVSATSTTICSSSSRVDYIIHSQAKAVSSKHCIKGSSFACKASSSGRRRNPDFSRQTRHGFSRNRNRDNEGRDNFLNLEESDVLSSKNESLLSFPNAPKSHRPPAPGPKENEIVELFRKVQGQLRDRAAMKEEKRTEPLKGQGKESETVDSLLKLLRKHSAEQGKRSSSNETIPNQVENNGSNDDFQESSSLSNRPVSNFQRKSPVPRVKYQPIYSGETDVNGRRIKNEPELELEPELVSELEAEPDVSFPNERVVNSSLIRTLDIEEGKPKLNENKELSKMKLTELKALAKSQGMKGFSKMKKSELVELLLEA